MIMKYVRDSVEKIEKNKIKFLIKNYLYLFLYLTQADIHNTLSNQQTVKKKTCEIHEKLILNNLYSISSIAFCVSLYYFRMQAVVCKEFSKNLF